MHLPVYNLCKLFVNVAVLICMAAATLNADSIQAIGSEYDPKGVAIVENLKKNIKPLFGNPWDGPDYSHYPGLSWSEDKPRTLKAITLPPENCSLQGRLEISHLPGLERIQIKHINGLAKLYTGKLTPQQDLRIHNLPDLVSLDIGWLIKDTRAIDLQDVVTLPNLRELNLKHGRYDDDEYQYLRELKKLEILNLEGSTFSDLSILSDLPNLKKVVLENCGMKRLEKGWFDGNFGRVAGSLKFEGLRSESLIEINLRGNSIKKIEGLEYLPRLETLDLTANSISRIEGLESLSSLMHLNLNNNQISRIEGLGSLSSLMHLNLRKNKISRIEGLDKLIRLNSLVLYGNPIAKIENLDNLPSLRRLELGSIPTLAGPNSLTQLEELDINCLDNRNQDKDTLAMLTSLSGLEKMTGLKSLAVSWAKLSNFTGINELKNLKHLTINNSFSSKQVSLEGINHLTDLISLNISSDNISDISSLHNLSGLEILNLSGNDQISNLEVLKSLPKLKDLNLGRLPLIDVNMLGGLNKLERLDLGYTKLTSLAGLKNLNNLEELILTYTPITDLSGLAEAAPNLKKLDLSKTALTALTTMGELWELTELNLSYSKLRGTLILPNLPKIKEFDLSANRISSIASWETLPTTARINVNKNSLPLSFLYRLQQDQIETGRTWIYDVAQNHIGGDIKLKKGGVYDLSREAVINGQLTKFEIYNVTNKSRAFPANYKNLVVSQDKNGRFIFNEPGKFTIVMSNEAVPVFEFVHFFGLIPGYLSPEPLKAGSGEITVE